MKFNFKVRAKNLTFWISILVSVATIIGSYFGVKGEELTSWGKLFEILVHAISNPYLLFMIVVSIVTTAISYTDKGISDTGFVMGLDKPRDDKDPKQAAGFITDSDIVPEIQDKEVKYYEKHEDGSEINEEYFDNDEQPFKDHSKPYGVDWDEDITVGGESVENESTSTHMDK